ncbi:permease prefix domain 1-containing protein [Paenibacillus sp. S-38]|uniref:permease prefix domain 1-containing protein n=1 Tax=Paenibacillus sp. S-38 TaxID=3416710 RepID=UPI003CEDFB09
MDKIDRYLLSILRGTFLRREEKAEWREEMRTHIACSVEELEAEGLGREDALERTLRQFGDPRMLRRELTRQTYGASLDVLLPVSVLFLGWYAYAVVEELQVHYLGRGIGVVSLTLLAGMLSLLLTRKTADRWAVMLTLLPFGLVFGLQKLQVPGAFALVLRRSAG